MKHAEDGRIAYRMKRETGPVRGPTQRFLTRQPCRLTRQPCRLTCQKLELTAVRTELGAGNGLEAQGRRSAGAAVSAAWRRRADVGLQVGTHVAIPLRYGWTRPRCRSGSMHELPARSPVCAEELMRVMFCVLGEGRGHMTQAIAAKKIIESAGHELVAVTLGVSPQRQVPDYFEAAMNQRVTRLPTVTLTFRGDRTFSWADSFVDDVRKSPSILRSMRDIDRIVSETKPDIILNFFDSLAALYTITRVRRPPVLNIAHQFIFLHPDYLTTPQASRHLWIMKNYSRLMSVRATTLALSLHEVPDLSDKRLFICPPLLREQATALEPRPDGQFVLVYLLTHGYTEQLIRWSDAHPQTRLHCFYDKPGAPPEWVHSPSLTFHRLDGEKFLRMMADCSHVVSTAGFELVAEASWLGKPLLVVPVENHPEQQLNALEVQRLGLGIAESRFNLDRLAELPGRLPNASCQTWFSGARSRLLEIIEHARSVQA
ncbi:UDP- glucuronosyltransferase [Archangium gephyra]|nr:UDP- glucuronosyltransferase [Archangium gephyra]